MKKRKVTYGINGLMTCQVVLSAGNTKIKVMFSDGSITATGKRPATFTTDSLMMQHIIENSEQFKKGYIFRYRSLILNEDVTIEHNPKYPEHHHHHHHHEGCPRPGEDRIEGNLVPDVELGTTATDAETAPEENVELSSEVEVSDVTENTQEEKAAEERIVKTFASNDDAKDYLEEAFGIKASQVRNRPEIIKVAAANGVDIVFE